jgi:hypothetical protein
MKLDLEGRSNNLMQKGTETKKTETVKGSGRVGPEGSTD